MKANQWTPLAERFWANVTKGDGCWEWQGRRGLGRNAYGSLDVHGHRVRAHRVSWEMEHGPIPEGLWVLHHCDNPPCVRPDHLYLGTAQNNALDMVTRGRVSRSPLIGRGRHASGDTHGTKTHPESVRRVLSDEQVRSIRERRAAGDGIAEIAASFGISYVYVAGLTRGQRRPEAGGPFTTDWTARGANHGAAKLTDDQVRQMRERRTAGETVTALASAFGVSLATTSRIVNGHRWRHV